MRRQVLAASVVCHARSQRVYGERHGVLTELVRHLGLVDRLQGDGDSLRSEPGVLQWPHLRPASRRSIQRVVPIDETYAVRSTWRRRASPRSFAIERSRRTSYVPFGSATTRPDSFSPQVATNEPAGDFGRCLASSVHDSVHGITAHAPDVMLTLPIFFALFTGFEIAHAAKASSDSLKLPSTTTRRSAFGLNTHAVPR